MKELQSKYEYAENAKTNEVGYRKKPCNCGAKSVNNEIIPQDLDTVLLYRGVVQTIIEEQRVYPDTLVLGLSQQQFDGLKNDPKNRFAVPSEENKKKMLGRYGKAD
jgi:hypothetical protein